MRPAPGVQLRCIKGTVLGARSGNDSRALSVFFLTSSRLLLPRFRTGALFTEVPHDITTQSGEDVEMACSFRGAGSPSSLEIQWWYIKAHQDWQQEPPQMTNNMVVPQGETSRDATKISVVKVAGGNISHKLRLSNVKPSDEGTYECRVIDFTGSVAQHHRVRAHLQVEPDSIQGSDGVKQRDAELRSWGNLQAGRHQAEGRGLMRSAGSTSDCTDSCAL
ncbi:V-set and transmembrane domain-containing protein 2-like protein [Takifugu flavidus]|uniref:V-set and transmembrane domain-containing protein 2-like protein n=1 Tax=Takifugu flavidus TaxID=433684 RepID=A0A5C6N3F9_9TELE|nr:V-set and transmembrane domain-containing protein 2-like protein [Takifugu flavidus]